MKRTGWEASPAGSGSREPLLSTGGLSRIILISQGIVRAAASLPVNFRLRIISESNNLGNERRPIFCETRTLSLHCRIFRDGRRLTPHIFHQRTGRAPGSASLDSLE